MTYVLGPLSPQCWAIFIWVKWINVYLGILQMYMCLRFTDSLTIFFVALKDLTGTNEIDVASKIIDIFNVHYGDLDFTCEMENRNCSLF